MNARQFHLLYRVESTHWWYQSTHRLIVDALRSRAPRPSRIVDIGCGTGGLLAHLSPLGPVTALEPSSVGFRLARRRARTLPNVTVIQGGISAAAVFHDGSLDCVTCIDVLYHEHVQSWRGALRMFHRKLRPDGLLVLQVAAFPCLSGAHDRAVEGARRFQRVSLARVLHRLGFDLELCSHRFSWLFPGLCAVRNWNKLFKSAPREANDLTLFARFPAPLQHAAQEVSLGVALAENQLVLSGACLPFGSSLFVLARKRSETC